MIFFIFFILQTNARIFLLFVQFSKLEQYKKMYKML